MMCFIVMLVSEEDTKTTRRASEFSRQRFEWQLSFPSGACMEDDFTYDFAGIFEVNGD